ncbi:MAG TPA: phosphatidylglycerol lysyltransferase domain-containing protein, partial [Candidatus Limnocylindrales bacterium]|nr:phosphatidylglycerol lysyltransferase domain-containing protein [Candidatus Limnocylindrales bacterium]
IATHRRYEVGTSQRVARLAAMLVLAGIALAVSAGIVSSAGDVGQVVVDAVGSLLDLATPGPLPGIAVVGTILIVARLGYLIAAALALDPVEDERPPERVAAARQALARLGSGSLVPYHGGPMCTAVADAEGRAAMAVAVAGRSVVALGDPAGDPLAGRRLLEAWRTGCERRDVVPAIYQASAGLVASLRRAGWHAILVGREAIVDPVAFDLRASTVANLRHTVTRSRRGGTQTLWSTDGLAGLGNPSLVERLAALDQDWRRRAGPQLGFTVGQFEPLDRTRSAVAVAVNGEGEPLAFAVFRPTGADGGWMLDIMRRSRSGVPGSVEACVLAAIQGFAAMGVRRLSLGLAPLAGLDPAVGPPAERLLARAAAVIRPIYDHKGLAFFKNKFAPEWEPRYLVVVHWWDLPGALAALVRLHLGGSWPRVVRSVVVGLVPAR